MTSVLGSTLHILIGYEARPSGMQALFYIVTFIGIAAAARCVRAATPVNKLKAA